MITAHQAKARILAGAVLISFSPVLVKFATSRGLGPSAVACYRTAIGGLGLLLFALVWHQSLRLSKTALGWAFLAGFFFFVDLSCWHRSIIYTGAGMATILGNTQVFAVALFSYWIFAERLSLRFALSAILAFLGLVLLVGLGSEQVIFSPRYLQGVALGLGTGLCYAAYLICLKKGSTLPESGSLLAFLIWASFFSTILLAVLSVFEEGRMFPPDLTTLTALTGLGLIIHGLAWWIISNALPAVPTAQAGLLLLAQPTLAIGWGVLFFAEQLSPIQALGAALTLGAMYIGSLKSKS